MISKNKTASCPNSLEIAKFMVSEGNSALLRNCNCRSLAGIYFHIFLRTEVFLSRVYKKSLHDLSLGKLVNFVPLFSSLGNTEILVNQFESFP